MNSRNVIPLSIVMLKETHAKTDFCEINLRQSSNCIPNPEPRQVDSEKTERSELFSIDIYFIL